MTDNQKKLRDLILASEGKTLEDELVFGCRVKIKKGAFKDDIFILRNGESFLQIRSSGSFMTGGCGCCSCNFEREDFEIIGLPLTLERVLRALGKELHVTGYPSEDLFSIQIRDGSLVAETIESVEWNLEGEQTNETILKLITLLS